MKTKHKYFIQILSRNQAIENWIKLRDKAIYECQEAHGLSFKELEAEYAIFELETRRATA